MSELLKAFVCDLRQMDQQAGRSAPLRGVRPRLEWIGVGEIDAGTVQARTFSSPEETEALRESVARNGVLQPLVVRPTPKGSKRYEVVAGHRRLDASIHAQLSTVPCIIRNLDDDEAHLVMVAENVVREELHPIDEAFAYRDLIEKGFVANQGEIAEWMGVSRTRVNRKIQLANLHPQIIRHVREKRPESIRESHLEELLKAKDPQEQLALYHRAVEEKLTVGALRQTKVGGRVKRSTNGNGSKTQKEKVYEFPEGKILLTRKGLRFSPSKNFKGDLEPEDLIAPLQKLLIRLERECASYEKRFIARARVPATPTARS